MVLGFDVEYHHNKPLLIQISSASLVLLFVLKGAEKLPPILTSFFTSNHYVKCGVGVASDLSALRKAFNVDFAGIFDLGHFARDKKLVGGIWELTTLGTDLLGFGKVHQFRYNGGKLGEQQIQYAARDAWLGFMLADYMFECLKTPKLSTLHAFCLDYIAHKKWEPTVEINDTKESAQPKSQENHDLQTKDGGDDGDGDGDYGDYDSDEYEGSQILSNPTLMTSHSIRNQLEHARDINDKFQREEDRIQELVQQLANKVDSQAQTDARTSTTSEEVDEGDKVIINWA